MASGRLVHSDPLGPGQVAGRAVRAYSVATVPAVDRSLCQLADWLATQIAIAPEFGISYLHRWRHDMNMLLDRRLELMTPVERD
jgi:hypothetical protein